MDARSDLFAAGAILFEMLAGRPAFGGRNVVESAARHAPRAAAGADRVARGRGGGSRDTQGARQAPGRPPAYRQGDGRVVAHGAWSVRRRYAGAGARSDASRGVAISGVAVGSRDRFPRLQPARRHRHLALAIRVADRAVQRVRGTLRGRGAGPQGAGSRGRRRPGRDRDPVAIGSRFKSRRSSWRLRAERCSPRIRPCRRWAICSGCSTTWRAGWSTPSRCR